MLQLAGFGPCMDEPPQAEACATDNTTTLDHASGPYRGQSQPKVPAVSNPYTSPSTTSLIVMAQV